MVNVFKKVINKSVPIDTPVTIDMIDLKDSFRDNEILGECIKKEMNKLNRYISNMTETHATPFFYSSLLTIYTNEDKTKETHFANENYYYSLGALLSPIETDKYDFYDFERSSNATVFYNKINTESELSYYTNLYKIYLKQKEDSTNLIELNNIFNDKSTNLFIRLNKRKKWIDINQDLYPNYNFDKEVEYASNFTIKTFIERIIKIIEILLKNKTEILNYLENTKVNIRGLTEQDEEKLNLFIAVKFLEELEEVNDEYKQRFLYYITNYFNELENRKKSNLSIISLGKKVTSKNLYEKYQRVLVNNPNLMTLNFKEDEFTNMTKDEVEEFLIEFLKELEANWELLPNDNEKVDKILINTIIKKTKGITEKERLIKEKRLIELYTEKKHFYDKTDPFYRVKGKNTFDGYIGFIYSNGLVILDKFYNNAEAGKLADGEAIYVMNMNEFYELSRYSKSTLIENKLCRRIIHKGNWQERLKKVIESSKKTDVVKDTNKLIKEKKLIKEEP